MSRKLSILVLAMLTTLAMAAAAAAQPTSLTVRVRAHDAKFVGVGVGDVQVTVRDFFSREVLAGGMITGGTGDTAVMMKNPRGRDTVLSHKKGTAGLVLTLDIDTPKKLLVEIDGPMSAGSGVHHDSKTTWLIPGRDITGDGLLFEIYGLIVRNYSPTPHQFLAAGETAVIGTHVTPMCGCPVRPDFIWDTKNYEVTAVITKNGSKVAELPLKYAGRISDFEARYTFTAPGTYKVTVIAADDKNNQGADTTSYVVIPAKKLAKIAGKK